MKQQVPSIARFIVFFLAMAASAAFGAENSQKLNYGMGILNIRSQSVGQSFRLTLPLLVPGDIKPGWQTFAQATWTNVWAQEKNYLLDYEMLDSSLGFSYGFNQRLGMSVVVDSRSYFGGEMDGFIQGFHDLLGIGQNNRNNYPKGRAVISEFDPATGALIGQNSAHDLNNSGLNLLVNYNFIHDNRVLPAVNLYCVARYAFESADIVTQEDGLDLGAGIGLAKRWTPNFYTYGIAGYTLYDDQDETQKTAIELKRNQFTGLFAISYTLSPDTAILAQYLYSTSVVETIRGLDEPSHEVHLGLKFRVGKRSVIDLSIIENIITMDNSPDFGVHLGWRLDL
ncbi:MAG: DUF3187 family protein [Desulfobacteraceae bacterium]|nr:DUF3187 family protein [Desulfobacteraceae bacterium]